MKTLNNIVNAAETLRNNAIGAICAAVIPLCEDGRKEVSMDMQGDRFVDPTDGVCDNYTITIRTDIGDSVWVGNEDSEAEREITEVTLSELIEIASNLSYEDGYEVIDAIGQFD